MQLLPQLHTWHAELHVVGDVQHTQAAEGAGAIVDDEIKGLVPRDKHEVSSQLRHQGHGQHTAMQAQPLHLRMANSTIQAIRARACADAVQYEYGVQYALQRCK